MPLTIGWRDIVTRLFFTVLAGALIGWNRGEHGHPAGLRTTILVCLAASIATIEMNLLLDTRGKAQDSFAVLDLARYPLGILSGMGFIGAGAIIRRDNVVQGVTTAATLWFVTMIGLCIGGGQIGIGVVGAVLGFVVLSVLKRLEEWLPIDRQATVELTVESDSPASEALRQCLAAEGYQVVQSAWSESGEPARRHIRYEVTWRGQKHAPGPAASLSRLGRMPGVLALGWELGPLPRDG